MSSTDSQRARDEIHAGDPSGGRMTRREVLVAGASTALLIGGLAACGGGSQTTHTTQTPTTPSRGGTLRLGMVTAGSAELVVPSINSIPDGVRTALLYNPLFRLGDDLRTLEPMLALKAEPNADATVWTFTLRPEVTWHDGKAFTADDVVHTIKSWGASDSLTYGKFNGLVDYKAVRARGKLTVEVPLLVPSGDFPALVTGTDFSTYIVPAGSTLKELQRNPVGTGPFKYQSFKPGSQSVFARNPDYWVHGKPLVDTVIINSGFTDENARKNAFLAGNVDILPVLPPLMARQLTSSAKVNLLRATSPITSVFYMDVKRAPFTDVRVRQALRLLLDREAMVNEVLAGYGRIGNDLFGIGAEFYAGDLKRERDVEQAKSLLRAAGQSDLKVSLATSNAGPGFVEAATLFAAQAAEGGVTITPDVKSPATYFTPPGYPYTFGMDYFNSQPSLLAYYNFTFRQYNNTRWGFDKSMSAASAAYPQSGDLWRPVQEKQFNEGGYITWGHPDNLDALAPNVNGMKPSHVVALSNIDLNDAWLS